MDRKEYYTEIERIAEWLSSGDYKEETGHDDKNIALRELLDYHSYTIGYCSAYQVMGFTENEDAIFEVGFTTNHNDYYASINCRFARHAMEADIHDAISRKLEVSDAKE